MTIEKPLVSIMIPTYNQPDFLPEAVDSALKQTYPNLEIIIADDKSTSIEVQAILDKYQKDPRVKVCRNDINRGRVGNYQKTLYTEANGDWVVNLDGDDFFYDDSFIESAIELASNNPDLVLISGRYVDLSPSGELKSCRANRGAPRVCSPEEAYSGIITDDFFPFHGSTLYKRTQAIAIGFYQHDIISADMESLLRLMQTGKIGIIPSKAMVRRRHGGNVSCSLTVDTFIDDLISFTAPLRVGKGIKTIVPKDWLKKWVNDYSFHKGKDNAYKILKNIHSNAGYFQYLRAIAECLPWVAFRIFIQPKNILKIFKNCFVKTV